MFPVEIGEFREAIADHFDNPVAKYVMWHFYPGTLQHFTLDDLKGLMPWRRKALQKRSGGISVQVADDKAEQQLLRWFQSYTEILTYHDVRFLTCASEDEGMEIIRKAIAAA